MPGSIPYNDVDWTHVYPSFDGSTQSQSNHGAHDMNPWTHLGFSAQAASDITGTLGLNQATRAEVNANHVHSIMSGYSSVASAVYHHIEIESNDSNDMDGVPSISDDLTGQATAYDRHAHNYLSNMRNASSPPEQHQSNFPTTLSLPESLLHEVLDEESSQQGRSRTQHLTSTSQSRIGTIYSTNKARHYLFKCSVPQCGRTFNRPYDFDRHYNGAHALTKTVYWCPELGCKRSDCGGNKPFPRSDKMMDHFRKAHGNGQVMET